MRPIWIRRHEGERRYLPASQRQGIEAVQTELVPLQAAIALMSGRPAGDKDALEEMFDALADPKGHLFCKVCFVDLKTEAHINSCDIRNMYLKVRDEDPQPLKL
jgi:hypothetical protein